MRDLQTIVQDNYAAAAHACQQEGLPLLLERNDLQAIQWQRIPLPKLADLPRGYAPCRAWESVEEAWPHLRAGYAYAEFSAGGGYVVEFARVEAA